MMPELIALRERQLANSWAQLYPFVRFGLTKADLRELVDTMKDNFDEPLADAEIRAISHPSIPDKILLWIERQQFGADLQAAATPDKYMNDLADLVFEFLDQYLAALTPTYHYSENSPYWGFY